MLSQRVAYSTLVCIGVLNAIVKPAILAVRTDGLLAAVTNGFGVNWVVWMALAIGLWRIQDARDAPVSRTDVFLISVAAVGLLVPLASASWVSFGAACLVASFIRRGDRGAIGLLIIGLAALRDPFAKALLDLLAAPILAFDAAASRGFAAILTGSAQANGNVLSAAQDHGLLIMSGCSSLTNLSFALLAWTSILLGFARPSVWLIVGGGLALSILTVLMNAARLSLMSVSLDIYTIVHDGWGADIFLALTTVLTVSTVAIGLRHAR